MPSLNSDNPGAIQDRLSRTPGAESPSGTGTVLYRRWSIEHIKPCLLLWRPYSGGLESNAALLHGVLLSARSGRSIAVLASPVESDTPWRSTTFVPTGEDSKIFTWSRIAAIETSEQSCGDVERIRPVLLRNRAKKLASSRDKSKEPAVIARLWVALVEWLNADAAVVRETLAAAESELRMDASVEPSALAMSLSRLDVLRNSAR